MHRRAFVVVLEGYKWPQVVVVVVMVVGMES